MADPAVAPGPGTFGPKFEVLRALGRGGMGVVYEARHVALGRRVAIKQLGIAGAAPEAQRRFHREAELVARLRHPHIVEILDFDTAPSGEPFFVMELLEGEDLATRLLRGPLPPAEAVAVLEQVAGALDFAHQNQVVHRDLKPANVFLARATSGGAVVKLLDFGVARDEAAALQTAEGVVVGTLAYMAPEQIAGRTVGARADVYAGAVLLYEMLTGRPPFVGSVAELPARILGGTPTSPALLVRSLPEPLAQATLWGLARDPEARPATAGALAMAARAALGPAAPAAAVAAFAVTEVLPSMPSTSASPAPAERGSGSGRSSSARAAATTAVAAVHARPRVGRLALQAIGHGDDDGTVAGLDEAVSAALHGLGRDAEIVDLGSPAGGGSGVSGEIGRAASVHVVVSGSVQRAGERLRVTLHVARPAAAGDDDDPDRFVGRVDGSVADLFDLEDRVAALVAVEVVPRARRAMMEERFAGGATSPAARAALIAATRRFNAVWHTRQHLVECVRQADRAREIEPGVEQAWFLGVIGRLALAEISAGSHAERLLREVLALVDGQPGVAPGGDLPATQAAVARGLLGDLAGAAAVLRDRANAGRLPLFEHFERRVEDWRLEWDAALAGARKLAAADPTYAWARSVLASLLLALGRHEEAEAPIRELCAIEAEDRQPVRHPRSSARAMRHFGGGALLGAYHLARGEVRPALEVLAAERQALLGLEHVFRDRALYFTERLLAQVAAAEGEGTLAAECLASTQVYERTLRGDLSGPEGDLRLGMASQLFWVPGAWALTAPPAGTPVPRLHHYYRAMAALRAGDRDGAARALDDLAAASAAPEERAIADLLRQNLAAIGPLYAPPSAGAACVLHFWRRSGRGA